MRKHLLALCSHHMLGEPISEPQRVYGGLLHTMWRIDTKSGTYAIKELSPDINLHNHGIWANYELTEHIAANFASLGISAISALAQANQHLFASHESWFLVYPWVDAKALDKDVVSANHALKIAAVLAKMHTINLVVPNHQELSFDTHTNGTIKARIELSREHECPFAAALQKHQDTILSINDAFIKAIPLLKDTTVISHGDLDQKNVLWDNEDNPILIDWESARLMNPTHAMITVGLDWSGITTPEFNQALFINMIQVYKKSGGNFNKDHVYAALYACLGNWINWMMYNIQRSCSVPGTEQQLLGVREVNQVLPIILRLDGAISDLVTLLLDAP